MSRIFGYVPGVPVGSSFADRHDLSRAGVHRPTQAGISGSSHEGADSIVLSGGYEDDEDHGDLILYTGHGGRDPLKGAQTGHQYLVRGNKALALSCLRGLPVRVVRGSRFTSSHAPSAGYRYDGLYQVRDYWRERGKSGYFVWRFRLERMEVPPPEMTQQARVITTSRIIRDSERARYVKTLYDYRCQVCNQRLETPAGPYAEAAHVRPLGAPHHGPDVPENILCLCPNHHVLFDYGALAVAEDLSLIGAKGLLTVLPTHTLSRDHLRYHREHYGFDADL